MRRSADPKTTLLASVPLFAGLDEDAMASVAATAELVDVPAHRELAREGDLGRFLYVIVEGIVQVRRGDQVLAYLNAGDVVGELAVLGDGRRTATLTTSADCRLVAIDRRHLAGLVEADAAIGSRLGLVADRRRDDNATRAA